MPLDVSIIIPTYNRIETLSRALMALETQTIDRKRFEIVVVDDGSTDDTEARLQPYAECGAIRYFRQANGGPARARNMGLREARGEWVAFIGDDILPVSRWLEAHLAEHARWNDERVAVLGLTEWAQHIYPTPLMKMPGLGENFEYDLIHTGQVDVTHLPHSFFYTSNVSASRRFLIDQELFFDEDFRYAMGEDGELAYRLQARGMRLVYAASALAYHEHRLSFDQLCRRWRLMGQMSILQAKKHPAWADLRFLRLSWRGKMRRAVRRFVATLLSPGLRLADKQCWPIRSSGWLYHAYAFVFDVWRLEGLWQGLKLYNVTPDAST